MRSGKMGKQFVEGEGDEGTKGKRKRNYGVMKNEWSEKMEWDKDTKKIKKKKKEV